MMQTEVNVCLHGTPGEWIPRNRRIPQSVVV